MIIRVWGVVNDAEVEFTPVPDLPGYWEGYAPRVPGLQNIQIWAESDSGLRGYLQCTVMLDYHAHVKVRLLLLPWIIRESIRYKTDIVGDPYIVKLKCCRKAV